MSQCKKAPGTLGSGGHSLGSCLVHAAHVGSGGSGSGGLLLAGPPHKSLSAPAGAPFHLLGRSESARHQGFAQRQPLGSRGRQEGPRNTRFRGP